MPPASSAARAKGIHKRRLELRNQLWCDAPNVVWSRKENDGYTSIPRTIPLLALLISQLSEKGNPSGVYWDIWCRAFDEGFIEVTDEQEFAYSSGYTGNRALRTWQEHIKALESLGFIRLAPKGNRQIGYVLLLNPYIVVKRLREEGKVPEQAWWNAFTARMSQIGAKFPIDDDGDGDGDDVEDKPVKRPLKQKSKPAKAKARR
jgi:hypothetical protein